VQIVKRIALNCTIVHRGLPVIVTTRVAETQFHQPQSDGSTSEVTHICGLREAVMWVNITLTLSFTFNQRVTSRNALNRNDFNESQDFNKANLIKNLYVVIFMYRTRSCRDRNAHKSSRVKELYISNASNIVTIVSYLLLFNFLR